MSSRKHAAANRHVREIARARPARAHDSAAESHGAFHTEPDEVIVNCRFSRPVASAIAAALAWTALADPAQACGGFFCSQQAGVNQAAERIVFADNGDGTITQRCWSTRYFASMRTCPT